MRLREQSVELFPTPVTARQRLAHIEKCGRVCYKSEDRIGLDTDKKFVSGIIKRGHESVLEHAWIVLEVDKEEANETLRAILRQIKDGKGVYMRFTPSHRGAVVSGNVRAWRAFLRELASNGGLSRSFRALVASNPELFEGLGVTVSEGAEGCSEVDPATLRVEERYVHQAFTLKFVCDRGLSHEIVRHRPASYSQESTRYCNYSAEKFGEEITVIDPPEFPQWTESARAEWIQAVEAAEKQYFALLNAGISPQIARDVLPTCLKTELVMTATCDEWLHFLWLRTSEAAHPRIRELATQARKILAWQDPQIFGFA